MSDLEGKLAELQRKIQVEVQCKRAGQMMRTQLRDKQAISQCDQSIQDAQKRIEFLENEMVKVNLRMQRRDNPPPSSVSATSDTSSPAGTPDVANNPRRLSSLTDSSGHGSPGSSLTPASPNISSPNINPTPQTKRSITDLDQRKADAPISTAKVTLKLHEIAFKLDVEKKVKVATERMSKLYSLDPSMGDKKSRAEVASKIAECNEKLVLLKRALQRYQGLYIGDDDDEEGANATPVPEAGPEAEEEEEEGANAAVPGLSSKRLKAAAARRGVTGTLFLKIGMARQLAHAPARGLFRGSSGPETSVAVFIDNEATGRTKVSRQQRWGEEMQIPLERANELEVTLYDRGSGDSEIPVGLAWFKLAELVEELRRKQDDAALRASASAYITTSPSPSAAAGTSSRFLEENARLNQPQPPIPSTSAPVQGLGGAMAPAAPTPTVIVEGWWDVEPVGQIHLQLRYIRDGGRKAKAGRVASRLGRQGAMRKRREEVHELHGHRFISQQFYNIVKCAFCTEFLLNGNGYTCEDCHYTCHKRCYPKVVTRCVSRLAAKREDGDSAAAAAEEEEEEQLNHRIPHRWEAFANLSANWCCHCGLMLALGGGKNKSASRRCTECALTSHEVCAPLVPDFCGMSMEMANKMLSEVRAAKRRTVEREKRNKQLLQAQKERERYGLEPSSTPTTSSHPTHISPSSSGQAPGYPPLHSPTQASRPESTYDPYHEQHLQQQLQQKQQLQQQQQQHLYQQPGYQGTSGASVGGVSQTSSYTLASGAGSVSSGAPSIAGTTTTAATAISPIKRNQTLDDFKLIRVLGKGNFGKVMLAEEKATGNLYAIKVLKKEFILQNDEVESTRSEKRVFQAANRERHPFLVGLHSCFQTSSRIYFVMEYVNGGDLMLHIQKQQFSEARAKFYAAEVLMGLEYFHKNDIVYRDLKLDNILLAADGHIKIADYGLCKEQMGYGATTNTFCGTPEFMAPEILLEQRYGRAVDWWAFGVLIYEMLLGQSPFHGDDEEEIFDSILEDEVLYPINMSRDSVSILQRLLIKDPPKRLGSGPTDAQEIRDHPFFKDTDWDAMARKVIPPPYVPAIRSRTDTSNFDEEFTREPPVLTPVHSRLSNVDQGQFSGFSYVAEWAGEEKGW